MGWAAAGGRHTKLWRQDAGRRVAGVSLLQPDADQSLGGQSATVAPCIIVPFSYYLLIVPIMAWWFLVPSIGGLGVRESLAPLLLAARALPRSNRLP